MKNHEHTEITGPTLLCDSKGNLNPAAAGWSRFPVYTGNLKGHLLRKKKWNYWCVTGSRYLFSVTISDVDYAGLVFVYYMDFETGEYGEDTLTIPFASGITMGEEMNDTAVYESDKARVKFTYCKNQIQLSTYWKNIQGKQLESEITITVPPNHETLNIVVPWSETRFQYTSKQHCLPAQGYFKVNGREFRFTDDDAFACQDFGRGVWPYSISWNWGAFSTRANGHTIGFNSGDKWTDGTGITENSVCIDGRLYKITGPLKWNYNNRNFMQLWHIAGKQGAVETDLTFTPFFDRHSNTNLLILKSAVHQCFGKYSGTITVNGVTHTILQAIGWAEEHIAKW